MKTELANINQHCAPDGSWTPVRPCVARSGNATRRPGKATRARAMVGVPHFPREGVFAGAPFQIGRARDFSTAAVDFADKASFYHPCDFSVPRRRLCSIAVNAGPNANLSNCFRYIRRAYRRGLASPWTLAIFRQCLRLRIIIGPQRLGARMRAVSIMGDVAGPAHTACLASAPDPLDNACVDLLRKSPKTRNFRMCVSGVRAPIMSMGPVNGPADQSPCGDPHITAMGTKPMTFVSDAIDTFRAENPDMHALATYHFITVRPLHVPGTVAVYVVPRRDGERWSTTRDYPGGYADGYGEFADVADALTNAGMQIREMLDMPRDPFDVPSDAMNAAPTKPNANVSVANFNAVYRGEFVAEFGWMNATDVVFVRSVANAHLARVQIVRVGSEWRVGDMGEYTHHNALHNALRAAVDRLDGDAADAGTDEPFDGAATVDGLTDDQCARLETFKTDEMREWMRAVFVDHNRAMRASQIAHVEWMDAMDEIIGRLASRVDDGDAVDGCGCDIGNPNGDVICDECASIVQPDGGCECDAHGGPSPYDQRINGFHTSTYGVDNPTVEWSHPGIVPMERRPAAPIIVDGLTDACGWMDVPALAIDDMVGTFTTHAMRLPVFHVNTQTDEFGVWLPCDGWASFDGDDDVSDDDTQWALLYFPIGNDPFAPYMRPASETARVAPVTRVGVRSDHWTCDCGTDVFNDPWTNIADGGA
jgi:hypothetical protein